MSIDVTGKSVKLWVNNVQTKDGRSFNSYNVGISKKNSDGSYTNMYLKTKFGKDAYVPKDIPNGAQMDFEGFLTVDAYTDRSGNEVKNPALFVTKVIFHDMYDTQGFAEAEMDIPF